MINFPIGSEVKTEPAAAEQTWRQRLKEFDVGIKVGERKEEVKTWRWEILMRWHGLTWWAVGCLA